MNRRHLPRHALEPSRRRGVTSLDLLVSIPSTTMIIAALGACVALLVRSNSQDTRFYRDIQQIADASIQMAMEIEMANGIASTSATAIEFCVPDRNGDFLPEQIRYEWKTNSTSSQRDVYRRMNNGTESPVITNLTGFELQYSYASSSSIPNRFRSESVLLKKVDCVNSGSYLERSINSANQICMIFRPDNPSTFTRWDLGSVEFMLRSADTNANGTLRLRVMGAVNNLPDPNNVYADIQINNRDLSAKYQYMEFPLAPIDQIPSGTSLAVVLSTSAENPPIRVQCLSHSSNLPADLRMLQSSSGGSTWSTTNNTSARFLAMGFTPNSSSTLSERRNLVSVDLLMTGFAGTNPSRLASAKLLAQPEVP
jgi:hypothetical protein